LKTFKAYYAARNICRSSNFLVETTYKPTYNNTFRLGA
jgi:hypothetical protein